LLLSGALLHSSAFVAPQSPHQTASPSVPRIPLTRIYQTIDPLSSSHPFQSAVAAPQQRKKRLKTFTRYLEVECWKRQELRDLEQVLLSVSDACKQINRIVQRAQTDDLYGVALGADGLPLEETNVQGEVQQKLDVVCNTIMLRAFCGCSNSIVAVASEEEDEPRSCAEVMVRIFAIFMCLSLLFWCGHFLTSHLLIPQHDNSFSVGNYLVAMDPIDGSKNIDASLPVGSIFGIYKAPTGKEVDDSSFLQDGKHLVAAGYCLFS